MADARVQQLLGGFVLLKMDLTARDPNTPAMKAATKFGVESIPDLRVLAPDGTERSRVEAREAAGLASELKAALGK